MNDQAEVVTKRIIRVGLYARVSTLSGSTPKCSCPSCVSTPPAAHGRSLANMSMKACPARRNHAQH